MLRMVNRIVSASGNEGGLVHLDKVKQAYTRWIAMHTELRKTTSERRRRLEERDDHGEQLFAIHIWWPVLGSFDYLHPEYEINDYRDGSRFLDFAYVRPPYRISIEIDGYGPHHKQASRRKFSDDRFRQNQLVLDNWIVVRFSYDDIGERPRQCQQFLQQLLGKLYGLESSEKLALPLPASYRELLRWGQQRERESTFTPKEVQHLLGVSHCTARKYLQHLLQQGLLEQASGHKRIRTYRISSKVAQLII
ncbi:DNA-binding response regulator [Paenibacillus sp. TAF43_2]